MLLEHICVVRTLLQSTHVALLQWTWLVVVQTFLDPDRLCLVRHIGVLTEPRSELTLCLPIGAGLSPLLEVIAS